jgi:hypothetical protein
MRESVDVMPAFLTSSDEIQTCGAGGEVPLPELSKIKLSLRRLGSRFEEIRDCDPIQDAFRAL